MTRIHLSERQARVLGLTKPYKKTAPGNVDKYYRKKCHICKKVILKNQSHASIPIRNKYGVVIKIKDVHHNCRVKEGK